MKLPSLLRKELDWSRHRLATVVVLVVVVPSIFATGTLFFEHTVPEHSPVAVVAADDEVSRDELEIVRGALAFISDPRIVDTRDGAFRQLSREEVYAVVAVPPGLTDAGANVTVDVYIHGGVTIYKLPSRAITSVLSESLDQQLSATVEAERHVIGEETSLSEYLLPTFLMIYVMLVAFTYIPYTLATERPVYDRLRIKTSLGQVVVAKLLYFGVLVVVSIFVVYALSGAYGYTLEPPSVPAVGLFLLAYLALASLSTAVMFVTEFSNLGRIVNVAVFFALVPLSNLAYPAGFFSPLSKSVARANPLHYAMIVARSHMLRDVPVGLFADWFLGLGVCTVACLLVLRASIRYYLRTQ